MEKLLTVREVERILLPRRWLPIESWSAHNEKHSEAYKHGDGKNCEDDTYGKPGHLRPS